MTNLNRLKLRLATGILVASCCAGFLLASPYIGLKPKSHDARIVQIVIAILMFLVLTAFHIWVYKANKEIFERIDAIKALQRRIEDERSATLERISRESSYRR